MVYRRTHQVVKRLAARRSAILSAARDAAAAGGMAVAFAGVAWMTLDAHALEDWRAIVVAIAAGAIEYSMRIAVPVAKPPHGPSARRAKV